MRIFNDDLWLGWHGVRAHPDSPIGGGGTGRFRHPGTLEGDPFSSNAHPSSPLARSRSQPSADAVQSAINPRLSFSEYAENRMWDLLKTHPNQLGRALWIDFESCRRDERLSKGSVTSCDIFKPYADFDAQFRNWERTDCQTYVLDVIKYAYQKTGQIAVYRGLINTFKNRGTTGTVMAKYLTDNGWKAYLFMPDTENPADGNPEHTRMYRNASRSRTWWGVPLSGFIINYNPNSAGEPGQPRTPQTQKG
jgi:hypothetical protein